MPTNLKEALTELYFYRKGTAGGFMTCLFRAIEAADIYNTTRLGAGFPDEVAAFRLWQSVGDGVFKGVFENAPVEP